MASIQEILRPITLTKTVSRIAASTQTVLSWMGMQPGGQNEVFYGHGREGTYHIFNHVRTAGLGRAPGTAAGRIARNPVARVPFVYARMHFEVSLLAEELHNLAKIDDPRMRDEAGSTYIKMQMRSPGERAGNWRTQMVVGMLRDSLYIHESGDDWYFTYESSGGLTQVPFGMPSGNKDQLDMLGAGSIIDASWANAGANIPMHLGKINAAFQQLMGGRLTDIHCTFNVWDNVTSNDFVAAKAGIANAPFETFERKVGEGPDGTPINEYTGRLRIAPGVTWHISDDGLEIGAPGSEAFTKHWGDNNAVFMNSPASGIYSMYQGSEPIAEYDGGPETVRIGLSSWSKKTSNPTATEIFTLDNALPVNHIPASVAYGTVVF